MSFCLNTPERVSFQAIFGFRLPSTGDSAKMPIATVQFNLEPNLVPPLDPLPTAAFQIWVDADACPHEIKTILFRSAQKRRVRTILVANQKLRIPDSPYLSMLTVRHGMDVADQAIADSMKAGDLVITADIPLAAQVVAQGGLAIGLRGELFDENQVQARLASRNLMDHLRNSGMETSGPKPINGKDIQAFANQLDRILTRRQAKSS